jgi:hypothetical protein
MKLLDIINPWGALRAARKAINGYERALHTAASVNTETARMLDLDSRVSTRKIQNLEAEIKRLEKIIAEGHYRNPKTGRIGRRGEVFTK